MKNKFDRIAGCYDFLAWIVFGNQLRKAQVQFIDQIPPHSEVLIVGGGTGWLLEKIWMHDSSLKITYIEASEQMLKRAKARQKFENVEWIYGTENDIQKNKFDVAITPFLLDMFSESSLMDVIKKIDTGLRREGIWLASDFISVTWWHRVYLTIMYAFFKIVSNIQTGRLPDWQKVLYQSGYHSVESKSFFSGFVVTAIFKKNLS